jgi:uncharacterized protein
MDETTARDRNGLEVLSYDECLRLLGSRTVGRIAFVDAGTPIIVPVNYLLDGASVLIRSAPGSKLDTADRARPLAFQIDDHDPSTRTGWSVLLTGIADPVDEEEAIRYDRKLDAWALGDRQDVALLRLQADAVTGRRIDTPPPARG